MAKMTRSNLKSLVKECLFEILLEASGDVPEKLVESKRKTAPKKRSSRKHPLDNIAIGKSSPSRQKSPAVDVSSLTSDPVMAAIFQDTAATTLVEQAAAERGKPQKHADAAAAAASRSEPSELFGDASKNWAHLAFDD